MEYDSKRKPQMFDGCKVTISFKEQYAAGPKISESKVVRFSKYAADKIWAPLLVKYIPWILVGVLALAGDKISLV